MRNENIRQKIIRGAIVILLLMLGVFGWLLYQHNPDPDVSTPSTANPEQEENMPTEAAIMEAKLLLETHENIDVDLSIGRSEPITASDRSEMAHMLAKLAPIKEKSDKEIVRILMGFYPENARVEGIFASLLQYYRILDNLYSPEEKEQKALKLVNVIQEDVSTMREIEEKVAAKGQRDEELKRIDPDAYYAKEIQKWESGIPEMEARIQKAEAKGDSEYADTLRDFLAGYHERIEDLKWEQNREQNLEVEIQETVQRKMEEWEKNPPEWLKPYQQAMAEADKLLAELKNFVPAESGLAEPAVPSESLVSPSRDIDTSSNAPEDVAVSQQSTVTTLDPVKSVSAVYASFRPFRVDLDKKYFDVVVSQYMTTAEFDEFFPTQEDRDALKLRTSQLQKSVVSKVREVVSGVKGATPEQRQQLARELVTANYEKSFAESVLKALEPDVEE